MVDRGHAPRCLSTPLLRPLAWTLVALLWVLAYVILSVPHEWGQRAFNGFHVVMVPTVIFALLVTIAQQRWILGIIACVTVASPMPILMAGFYIFGFSETPPASS